jgi:hypothetical protein
VRADVHPSRGEETYERSAILRSKVSPRKQKSCAKRGKKSQSTCARVARAQVSERRKKPKRAAHLKSMRCVEIGALFA